MTDCRIHKRDSRCVWMAVLMVLFLHGRSDAQETLQTLSPKIWMCSLDLQTRESKKLFEITHLGSVGSPSLSSDGQRIAFEGAVQGAQPTSDSHVWVCNIDGAEMQDLGPGAMPTWSPRGKRIAFCKHSPEHGVWLMQADGSHQQLIDEAGWCAQWSPNGSMIAYTRRVNEAADFVVFNLVEDEFFPVFGDGRSGYSSFYWNFAWSPDSKRLCFKGQGPDNEIHVASVAVHNGLDLQVHFRGDDNIRADFAWVDANTVAFTQSSTEHEPNTLVTIPTDIQQPAARSAPQPIVGQLQSHANGSPAISTDGKTLIYISRSK
ncbi:MAG: translocation protein TolB [Fuerstiella sp.]|nr:translocation protein TolB [Fuerstiella sp.]